MSNSATMPISPAYKDTRFNRWSILTQIALFQKLACRRSKIIYLSPKRLVKFGPTVHLAEASALRLVAATTSVPVPKVYCAFRDEKSGNSYIVMERIDGEWLRWQNMSEEERKGIVGQLKSMWEELRGIVPFKPGAVCAADGGTLHDHRIWGAAGAKGMGPFETEAEFNLFLRNGVKTAENIRDEMVKTDVGRLIEMHREEEGRNLKTLFTHGDINGSNILVKDGKVVALIDFEMSGFYPEYWEYTTAVNSSYHVPGWREQVPKCLTPYPAELDMDNLWRMHFCDGP